MSRAQKQKEYILQLKQAKEAQGLTNQDIFNLIEERREYTSMSSIKRVFKEGSEDQNFRDETLRPIGRVLLGIGEPTPEPIKGDYEQQVNYYEQIEHLKAAVEYKTATIDQLSSEIQQQAVQIDRLRTLVDSRQEDIDQLRTQLAKREQQYENRDADARSLLEDVRRKDRKIAELMDKIEELRKA